MKTYSCVNCGLGLLDAISTKDIGKSITCPICYTRHVVMYNDTWVNEGELGWIYLEKD